MAGTTGHLLISVVTSIYMSTTPVTSLQIVLMKSMNHAT